MERFPIEVYLPAVAVPSLSTWAGALAAVLLASLVSFSLWTCRDNRKADPDNQQPANPAAAAVGSKRHTPFAWNSLIPILQDDLLRIIRMSPSALRCWQEQRSRQHGGMFWSRFMGTWVVNVVGLDNVKKVFSGEHSIVECFFPASVVQTLGPHAAGWATGPHHYKLRRTLAHLFTPAAIRTYLPLIQHSMETKLLEWAETAQAGRGIHVVPEAKTLVLNMMMQLVMGVSPDDAQQHVAPHSLPLLWKQLGEGICSLPINLPGTAYWRGLTARKLLLKLARAIMTAEVALETREEGRQGMCQLLLQTKGDDGQPIQLEELQDMCLSLMWAGHDTTASAITTMIWQLSVHPEVTQKLREEQGRVQLSHGGQITEAALKDMPYAEAVVKETLRYRLFVPWTPRVALKDFELGGYSVKKGTTLMLDVQSAVMDAVSQSHKNPSSDQLDPNVFNPDRWLDPDCAKRAGWLSFGHGPRMCVGYPLAVAQLKILAALLSRGYEWALSNPESETWTKFPVPTPADELPLAAFRSLDTKP